VEMNSKNSVRMWYRKEKDYSIHSSAEWSCRKDEQDTDGKKRSMLSGVGLGQEFWAEEVGTACYLVNRSPSLALDDKTPHEVWSGKKPSLQHLRVFGCDAYVHVPKENRSKLDKKDESVSLLVIKMV
jgi:hypothetical protein